MQANLIIKYTQNYWIKRGEDMEVTDFKMWRYPPQKSLIFKVDK